jgi:uncharacterized protein (DUF4415 family)
MRKEYDFKKLKPKPRNPSLTKGLKVAIHVRLDTDVVAWLREESEKAGLPYQTYLNFRLRQAMRPGSDVAITEEQVRAIVREEIKKIS